MVDKLLLIDDDEFSNILVGAIINDVKTIHHHKIESNGWDALKYLENCKKERSFPDLILVDLKMPEMDGFEFVEHYEKKFWREFRETKVMILTNSMLEVDRTKSLFYKSISNFIYKPLTEEKLLNIIKTF